MRIRAAVLEEFGRPPNVTEMELAEPKAGEVLVRLVACGVCHTDMCAASVVTLFAPQCGECVHCASPKTNLCTAIREQQNLGFLPDGTTRAEHTVTAARAHPVRPASTTCAPRSRGCSRCRPSGRRAHVAIATPSHAEA